MEMRCSRVGCGSVAVATFCFDARAALVWLDRLDPDRGLGAGVLCEVHADALTPPRGWYLRDRRRPAPRLWDERPATPPRRARSPRPAALRVTRDPGALEPLPLDPAEPPSVVPNGRPGRGLLDVERVLAAGGHGLLGRAFARVTDR